MTAVLTPVIFAGIVHRKIEDLESVNMAKAGVLTMAPALLLITQYIVCGNFRQKLHHTAKNLRFIYPNKKLNIELECQG